MEQKIVQGKLWDFLVSHGCYPEYEAKDYAVYSPTPQFLSLLESFYIEKVCFKNKL